MIVNWLRSFYTIYFGGMGAYAPYLNLYLSKQLGLSAALIGSLSGIASIIPFIAQPLWCRLADIKGKQNTLPLILVVAALGLGIYGFANNYYSALIAACVFAASSCAVNPVMDSLTISTLKTSGSRLVFADIRLWGSAGFVVTAILSGSAYVKLDSLRGIFPAYALSILLLVLLLLLAKLPSAPSTEAIQQQTSSTSMWKSPKARIFLAACCLNQLATLSGAAYIGLYMSRLGGSFFSVGLMSATSAVMEVPAGLLLGRLSRRIGVSKILLLAFILNGLRWFLVSITREPTFMYFIQMLGGVVFIAYYSSAVTLVDNLSPKSAKSSGQSVLWIATSGLSSLVGAPLGGLIFDRLGPSALYRAASVAAIIAAGLWLTQVRRTAVVEADTGKAV